MEHTTVYGEVRVRDNTLYIQITPTGFYERSLESLSDYESAERFLEEIAEKKWCNGGIIYKCWLKLYLSLAFQRLLQNMRCTGRKGIRTV